MKAREPEKAVEIFQRMKRENCRPSTDTYTMLINLYGKVREFCFLLEDLVAL